MNADEIKHNVRYRLTTLGQKDFEAFIDRLDEAMARAGLNLRSYLLPIGIAGRCPDDLTPYEIGHLARYFRLHVAPAVEPFDKAFYLSTGHETTSPLTEEGSGNGLPRRGKRAARPHVNRRHSR